MLLQFFVTEEMKTDYRFSFHKEKADDQTTSTLYSKESFILHY